MHLAEILEGEASDPDFEHMVDLAGLSPEETARLRNVHDLLLAAGPPAELPADLGLPAELARRPLRRRRRQKSSPSRTTAAVAPASAP